MPAFDALFASGRIVDLILLFTALEAAALTAWRARTGRGVPPGELAMFLLSGACLLLALRAALTGAAPTMMAAALLGALVAHAAMIALRWRAS